MRNTIDNNKPMDIHFISPRNKLKVYTGPKIECPYSNPYKKKKWLGIEYCRYILKDSKWLTHFNKHKKKDDLADSYLQGLYYIQNCV